MQRSSRSDGAALPAATIVLQATIASAQFREDLTVLNEYAPRHLASLARLRRWHACACARICFPFSKIYILHEWFACYDRVDVGPKSDHNIEMNNCWRCFLHSQSMPIVSICNRTPDTSVRLCDCIPESNGTFKQIRHCCHAQSHQCVASHDCQRTIL